MHLSLIVCTYMRSESLARLLGSVHDQIRYPDDILIVDGSTDHQTAMLMKTISMENLRYFSVDERHRGLTKQRNYGISKTLQQTDIICFLDDDTVLSPDYFKEIERIFNENPEIAGVGGVAKNENRWEEKSPDKSYPSKKYYALGNYVVKEGLRNVCRNYLGLQSPLLPGKMPNFSHGRTCGYPITGNFHEVDLLIGMSFSFRANVCHNLKFSEYFEGYGLYEDADYSIRAQKFGKLVVATSVLLDHFHDSAGRPNNYKYGKMVLRNGWYVWRLKHPNPGIKAVIKWYLIHLLLISIRLTNVITTGQRTQAFTDSVGRLVGMWSLIFNKPKIAR